MAMEAKWYHISTEKIRVRINSYIRVPRQRRKTPQQMERFAG
jgi:hypothetical protein